MNKDDLPPRSTPTYALYQREVFLDGATKGKLPEFNTDPDEMEVRRNPLFAHNKQFLPSADSVLLLPLLNRRCRTSRRRC